MQNYVQSALAILGAVYVITSTVATMLPKGTAVQRFFATVALDIRKLGIGGGTSE